MTRDNRRMRDTRTPLQRVRKPSRLMTSCSLKDSHLCRLLQSNFSGCPFSVGQSCKVEPA